MFTVKETSQFAAKQDIPRYPKEQFSEEKVVGQHNLGAFAVHKFCFQMLLSFLGTLKDHYLNLLKTIENEQSSICTCNARNE